MNSKSTTTVQGPKAIATDFLQKAAVGEVSEAYANYVSARFRHHNPFFRGDADSLKAGMKENAEKNPNKILEIQQVLQDGNLAVSWPPATSSSSAIGASPRSPAPRT
jgi:predicted SnoaL-like aldol condensation-catalyzing enzyme